MNKKLVYIVSDINKALAFEWISIELKKAGYAFEFILLNPGDSELEQFLIFNQIKVTRVECAGKKDWPSAWLRVYKLLKQTRPDVVHCHLLLANIIGLSAAMAAKIPVRIYTRHHSSFHHVYHPKGRIWDTLANKWATHIIAISKSVARILKEWEGVPSDKIYLIPHGFLFEEFENISVERIEHIREKLCIKSRGPVVGVISRFTKWKGVQYIIPAFKRLLVNYPDAVLLLFNARGDYQKEIISMFDDVMDHNYRIIPFEQDIFAAYKVMDIFIHVPIDDHSEAFGQTYVEALALGVPSVVTLSGIATDFIVNEENALVVPYQDSNSIYEKMMYLLKDCQIRCKITENGKRSVLERFELSRMVKKLEELYGI